MPDQTPAVENLESSLLFPVFIVASPLIPIPESYRINYNDDDDGDGEENGDDDI